MPHGGGTQALGRWRDPEREWRWSNRAAPGYALRLIAAQLVLAELDTTESGLQVALITVGEL